MLPANIIGFERTNTVSELAQLYTAATFYLNFSVEETMGLTTVEALACGTPVIVYDRTAIPEVVDKSCGWVVSSKQFDCVLEIIDSIKEKSPYQSACIARASMFERRRKYLEYLVLYKSLIKEDN